MKSKTEVAAGWVAMYGTHLPFIVLCDKFEIE